MEYQSSVENLDEDGYTQLDFSSRNITRRSIVSEKGISFSFNLHTVEKQEYIHTYVYILQNLAKRHNQSDSLNL